ncbi:MAG: hypothetical protein RR840_08545 [Clostridium sp.]
MNYLLKIKNKALVSSVLLYVIITTLSLISFGVAIWGIILATCPLIPVFLCTNVLTEEYDQKREGIVLITATPIYKLVLTRYVISFFYGQVFIIFMFLVAWLIGAEANVVRKYLITLIYSGFLSLLGLFLSNISKRTLIGFIVPTLYCMIQVIVSPYIFENSIPALITSLNLDLNEHIILSNIYFMLISIIVLFILNIFYLSKGEGIRHIIIKSTSIAVLIFAVIGISYTYLQNQRNTISSTIINNNPTYIIGTRDSAIAKYLDKRGISYIIQDDPKLSNSTENNIVILSSNNSKLINHTKKLLNLDINLNRDGVVSSNIGIHNATSYRSLFKNYLNSKNDLVLIETNNLKDLDIVLNEKKGNFLAVQGGKPLAKSPYTLDKYNMKSIISSSDLYNENSWILRKDRDTAMLYNNISEKDSKYILSIWKEIHKVVQTNILGENNYKYINVYFKKKPTNNNGDNISIYIKNTKRLESDSMIRLYNNMSNAYLKSDVLKPIKNETIKQGFASYITYVTIQNSIVKRESHPKLCELLESKDKWFIEEMKFSTTKTFNKLPEDKQYFASEMLSLIKDPKDVLNFIRDISNSTKELNDSELEEMYSKYVGEKIATTQFNKLKQ